MGGKNWKKEELEFLKENYSNKSQEFILDALPRRTWLSITQKAALLGVYRNVEILNLERNKTNLEKYGVKNVFQAKEIKETIKRTNLEKYGVENPQQSEAVKEKTLQTNLEKYGSKYTFQSEKIKEKIKETNLERYGVEYPQQSKEIQKTTKHNVLIKYGVDHISKIKEVGEKKKETNLKIYGKEFATQNKEIKEKTKLTNLAKYGVENPAQSEEIKNYIKKINLEKYGVENPQQNESIREKTLHTNLNKYGVKYTFQSEKIKDKIRETNLSKYGCINPLHSELTKKYNLEKYGVEYKNQRPSSIESMKKTNLEKYGVEIPSQSKEIQNKIYETKKKNNSFNISKPEENLHLYLINKYDGMTVKRNYKEDSRYPFAVDFYIVELDFFIELQGTWTHGKEPFNGTNLSPTWIEKEKVSKYYKNAVEIYSIKDPIKRKVALENNLNYLELWEKDIIAEDYLSVLLQNQGLPLKYSEDILIKEFKNIQEQEGSFSKDQNQNKIIEHFQPHFYRKERELWNNPSIRKKLIANRMKYKDKNSLDITIKQYLQGFKISGIYIGYSFFSPSWIKAFIKKYNIKSIYDPCAGWGHRLLGSYAITYIGNDCDKETYKGLCHIKDYFKLDKSILYNNLAEEFIPKEFYDAVFTCPPYFNTEIYAGDNTSTAKYTNYFSWLDIWWRKVIKNSLTCNPKYFSFIVNNKYKEDMKQICIQEGLLLIEEIPVSKNHLNHFQIKAENSKKGEFILIFENPKRPPTV